MQESKQKVTKVVSLVQICRKASKYVKSPLTLKVPVTLAADDFLKYFFLIFQRKQVLIFHGNHLLGR